MIYIIGSNGYIAKKIKKLIPKSNLTCISTKKTKDSIKTHIFKKKINEKWITKIDEHDVIFFLSSFGNIDFHEKNKKLINQNLRNIERNFFSKINSKSKIIFFHLIWSMEEIKIIFETILNQVQKMSMVKLK